MRAARRPDFIGQILDLDAICSSSSFCNLSIPFLQAGRAITRSHHFLILGPTLNPISFRGPATSELIGKNIMNWYC